MYDFTLNKLISDSCLQNHFSISNHFKSLLSLDLCERVLGDKQHRLKMWQQITFKAPTSDINHQENRNNL